MAGKTGELHQKLADWRKAMNAPMPRLKKPGETQQGG